MSLQINHSSEEIVRTSDQRNVLFGDTNTIANISADIATVSGKVNTNTADIIAVSADIISVSGDVVSVTTTVSENSASWADGGGIEVNTETGTVKVLSRVVVDTETKQILGYKATLSLAIGVNGKLKLTLVEDEEPELIHQGGDCDEEEGEPE
jgi:uncharacterized protein YcfL